MLLHVSYSFSYQKNVLPVSLDYKESITTLSIRYNENVLATSGHHLNVEWPFLHIGIASPVIGHNKALNDYVY